MTLVDTSVWINHFRVSDPKLERLAEDDMLAVHPFIVGEIACGNLRDRDEVLHAFSLLPQAAIASEDEVLRTLTKKSLWGSGLGWVDMHLLASAAAAGWNIMTADRALQQAAASLGVNA